MEDAEENCLLRCSVGRITGGNCGLYKAYPKETNSIALGSCCRDLSLHLKDVNLSGGKQTAKAPAADSEGSLISYRIGLFRYDPSMTVCPYHRYRLGIDWRPSRKCVFPHHHGSQLPHKGVSVNMSKTIMEKTGVLVPAGSGICVRCYSAFNTTYKEVNLSSSGQSSQQVTDKGEGVSASRSKASEIEENTDCNPCLSVLREVQNIPECDSIYSQDSQPSQNSNWSYDKDLSLNDVNHTLETLTRGTSSPIRARLQTDISSVKKSTVNYYKRKANEAVDAVLDMIAPGQSSQLKKLITEESPARSCSADHDTLIELYHQTTDNNLRAQILAAVSNDIKKSDLLKKIPGLTIYKIDQARLMSKSQNGISVPNKSKRRRHRMDKGKLQHALDFFFNPCFMQVVSFGTRNIELDSGESITIPDVVKTSCHSQIVKMYETLCEETNFTPLCQSTLFHILQACAASKRKNLHGLDNTAAEGEEGYKALQDLACRLHRSGIITEDDFKNIKGQLSSSRIYMKTDYKIHVQDSDMCSDHCITWGLSDPNDSDLVNVLSES